MLSQKGMGANVQHDRAAIERALTCSRGIQEHLRCTKLEEWNESNSKAIWKINDFETSLYIDWANVEHDCAAIQELHQAAGV